MKDGSCGRAFSFPAVDGGIDRGLVLSAAESGSRITFLDALSVSLVAVGAAAIVLREGVVCLVIVFPALYSLVLTGCSSGGSLFRRITTGSKLSVFPLLALLVVTDASYSSTERAMVTDEVLIRATPGEVLASPARVFGHSGIVRTIGFSVWDFPTRRKQPMAATSSERIGNACSAMGS